MADLDLIPFLLSSETEHWFKVTIQNKERAMKYIPLTLREKVNINNRLSFIEDEKKRTNELIISYCRQMLKKAYGDDSDFIDTLTNPIILSIYEAILVNINDRKLEVEKFYDSNKTKPLDVTKHTPNKLDGLVSVGNVMKDCNMTISDVASLDEMSLFVLMAYSNEVAVRESNVYQKHKGGKK